jgi:hypothetical protein
MLWDSAERGVVKKVTFVVFMLLLLIPFSTLAEASLKIWPGKLTITMPEGYTKETITYFIEATNHYDYGVNASTRIENPAIQQLSKNYTYIPNLSWITITPESLYLPQNSTGKFKISIDIPENEKSLQYDKSWETWVIFSSSESEGNAGGAAIRVEIAVKLFINTPQDNKSIMVQSFYFILAFIIPIVVTCIAIFYSKKRHDARSRKL